MKLLAFVLECAAVLGIVASVASLVVWPMLGFLRGRARSPALRAELSFVLAAVPALTAITAVAAAAAPSMRAWWAGAADHCASHAHHLHLCLVHATGLRPPVAIAGALFLSAFVFRAASLLAAWRDEQLLLSRLEGMGTLRAGRFPVVTVPGSPWLCLSAGVWRPRVIVSATLEQRLEEAEFAAALSHEEAHLHRRDPLANALLAVAGLFALPFVTRLAVSAYRSASEEASDAVAAHAVGDPGVVASALLKVASCRRSAGALHAHAAFGEHALERRVRRLLTIEGRARVTSWALPLSWAVAAITFVAGLLHSGALHHAVETLLHHVS